jgi:hypothetical protein
MPNPKKILKAVVAGKKAAQRRQTDKIQKNSVKVKSTKDPKRIDNLLKSLPKAPPRTAAEKTKSNRFIEKEINKLKKQRGK